MLALFTRLYRDVQLTKQKICALPFVPQVNCRTDIQQQACLYDFLVSVYFYCSFF